MKRMKVKKVISMALLVTMLLSVCMIAAAADSPASTKSSLHSRGAIRYREGSESVVIDSADLYTLADRLDVFKLRVAEQLGAIGTYLSRNPNGTPLTSEEGLYAAHQKPSAVDAADPLTLSFASILEAIAASQTIPTEPEAFGMGAETTFYKGEDGRLLTDAQAGAEQICVQAATAENLSAGTAAWVNGELILGTGGDNKAYHDLGYQKNTGGQSPGDSGGVNKARIIDMNTGSASYIVQEDMTDVFLCFSRVGGYTTPVLSSGEPIKLVAKNVETNSPWFQMSIYYAPKLSKGTVISNLYGTQKENVMSLLLTIDGSQKNGKVNGIRLAQNDTVKEYIVTEDMTDVFLYLAAPKSQMPNFTPMDDQAYVSFKLLKEVSRRYNEDGSTKYGSLYYIPKIKAGTKISNISPWRSYMVY